MQHIDVNPMGLDGFEFAEFTSPDPDTLARQFEAMGFVATHRHPARGAADARGRRMRTSRRCTARAGPARTTVSPA